VQAFGSEWEFSGMRFHGHLLLALPHLVAGLIGLAAGVVALYALKGGKLHRKSGMFFVYAMLLVAGSGVVMATLEGQKLNLLGGLLTFYLVTTALLTVVRREFEKGWVGSRASGSRLRLRHCAGTSGREQRLKPETRSPKPGS
jgi:uncharacterized membrane protein